MADIGRYPVITDPQNSDHLLALRTSSGEVVRIPLSEVIAKLSGRLIDLTDTPNDYVGKVGQTLAVNAEQDGMEFVSNNLSPTFQNLPDTPSYAGNALKYLRANATEDALEYRTLFLTDASDYPNSYAGQAGKFLKVHPSENFLEFTDIKQIEGVVYVNSEADLSDLLNVNNEYELQPNTSYWFTQSFELLKPLRFMSKTTDVFGNGVFNTVITYPGSGPVIRGDVGSAICLRYIQFTSSFGDGIQFNGEGASTGADVFLERSRVLAPAGYGLIADNPGQILLGDSLVLSATGMSFTGANCGVFYADNCANLMTAVGTALNFGTSVWQLLINIIGMPFEGTGSTAISGAAANGNLGPAAAALVQNCIVPPDMTALSGITTEDTKWRFNGNAGIDDSNTIAMAYISTPATTVVAAPDTDYDVAGTWTAQANTERATVNAAGVIEFQNLEQKKGNINCTFTANKVGGGTSTYQFKIQKDEGSGYFDLEAVDKTVTLTSGTLSSVTVLGIGKYKLGDKFKLVVRGIGTTSDVDVSVTQFVIG